MSSLFWIHLPKSEFEETWFLWMADRGWIWINIEVFPFICIHKEDIQVQRNKSESKFYHKWKGNNDKASFWMRLHRLLESLLALKVLSLSDNSHRKIILFTVVGFHLNSVSANTYLSIGWESDKSFIFPNG